jgi:hypothetical protein
MCALLIAMISGIWQARLSREALARAAAAERAAAQARAEIELARAQVQADHQPDSDASVVRASRHSNPKEAERVRQLYEEVNNLSQIQQHIADELQGHRGRSTSTAVSKEFTPAP